MRHKDLSAQVYRLEFATGQRELLKEIAPPEPAGNWGIAWVKVTADGKSYAYCYIQTAAVL